VGWLIPEFTKSVTLNLSAEDARREAIGRVLGLSGAATGLIGGLMILKANPAVKQLLGQTKSVSLTMTAAEAKQDATGKAVALIGTAVGVTGSVMVMTSNPKVKALLDAKIKALPAGLRDNRKLLTFAALGLLAGGTLYMLKSQAKTLMARYK
jgi:hypothetical protein